MSYPNVFDVLAGNALVVSMLVFPVLVQVCRNRVDAWALEDLNKRGEAPFMSGVIPPVAVVMEKWQFVARIRDKVGYVLMACFLYFIGRAVWLAIA